MICIHCFKMTGIRFVSHNGYFCLRPFGDGSFELLHRPFKYRARCRDVETFEERRLSAEAIAVIQPEFRPVFHQVS